jgi:hypothetical protein
LIGIFIISLIPSAIQADGQTFGVTSYIPVRFSDTEWRIGGQLGYSNNNLKTEYSEAPYQGHSLIDSEYKSINGAVGLSNNLKYRYEIIPLSIILQLGLSGSMNNQKSDKFNDYSPVNGTDISSSRSNSHNYQLNASPSADMALYYKNNFFISLLMNNAFSFGNEDYHSSSINESWSPKFHETDSIIYTKSKDSAKSDIYRKSYSIQFLIMPGWGRLYEGRFASAAIYIIEELRRNKLLLIEPSQAQMMQFAELIYQYRMRHIIDKRIHLIKSFQSILNYLKDQNLLDNCDIMTFLLVQDVWNYFPDEARSFGFKIRAGFGVDYSYYSRHENRKDLEYYLRLINRQDSLYPVDTIAYSNGSRSNDMHKKNKSFSDYLKLELIYAKPFNHRLQFDFNFQSQYYFKKWSDEYSGERLISRTAYARYILLSGSEQLRFFKDSRTRLSCGIKADYIYSQRKYDDYYHNTYNGPSVHRWKYMAVIGADYRLSIPTTLSLLIGYNSDNSRIYASPHEDGHNNYFNISLDISHYIY